MIVRLVRRKLPTTLPATAELVRAAAAALEELGRHPDAEALIRRPGHHLGCSVGPTSESMTSLAELRHRHDGHILTVTRPVGPLIPSDQSAVMEAAVATAALALDVIEAAMEPPGATTEDDPIASARVDTLGLAVRGLTRNGDVDCTTRPTPWGPAYVSALQGGIVPGGAIIDARMETEVVLDITMTRTSTDVTILAVERFLPMHDLSSVDLMRIVLEEGITEAEIEALTAAKTVG